MFVVPGFSRVRLKAVLRTGTRLGAPTYAPITIVDKAKHRLDSLLDSHSKATRKFDGMLTVGSSHAL
jgi:hypothetical protein